MVFKIMVARENNDRNIRPTGAFQFLVALFLYLKSLISIFSK
jgi:hypothetical protein